MFVIWIVPVLVYQIELKIQTFGIWVSIFGLWISVSFWGRTYCFGLRILLTIEIITLEYNIIQSLFKNKTRDLCDSVGVSYFRGFLVIYKKNNNPIRPTPFYTSLSIKKHRRRQNPIVSELNNGSQFWGYPLCPIVPLSIIFTADPLAPFYWPFRTRSDQWKKSGLKHDNFPIKIYTKKIKYVIWNSIFEGHFYQESQTKFFVSHSRAVRPLGHCLVNSLQATKNIFCKSLQTFRS